MSDQVDSARLRRPGAVPAGFLAAVALIVLAVLYFVGASMTGTTIPRDASVAGVRIGGLTRAQAADALQRSVSEKAAAPMTVSAGNVKITKRPSELGLFVDYEASVARAGGAHSWNPVAIWETLLGGKEHRLVVRTDRATLDAALERLAKRYDHPPTNARLTVDKTTPRVVEGSSGGTIKVEETARLVEKAYLTSTTVSAVVAKTEADITNAEARDVLEKIARPALASPITFKAGDKTFQVTPRMLAPALSFPAHKGGLEASVDARRLSDSVRPVLSRLGLEPPRDARVVVSGGKPAIIPSQDGTGVDPAQLANSVTSLLTTSSGRTGNVAIGVQKAGFSTADAQGLGIKEVTGEFTTRFPATAYRVNNIGKSAGLVNHTLLKPGEQFDMNKVLGPRTTERGWMAGGAIDGGKVVERMGGGISQTTTTTFNAIFFAGLEDVYHKPHSLYFSRYPMGREATLDYGSVDMKFRNDTGHGVLMQAFTNNPRVGGRGTVTVRVWSTRTYDVLATEPVQSRFRSPGEPIRDNSAVCTPQNAMTGFRVDFKRLFYQGGKLVRSEPFHWTYNPLTPRLCTNPDARRDRIVR